MSSNLRAIIANASALGVQAAIDELWEAPDFQKMGSEIERAFAAHFVMVMRIGRHSSMLAMPTDPFDGFFLAPQVEIGSYRVDFILGDGLKPGLLNCVAVECDGFDFHDRTPEQAGRDKARDRYLNQHVKAVARITGREIYRDVDQCLADALRILNRGDQSE